MNIKHFGYSIEPISVRERLRAETDLFERRIIASQQTLVIDSDAFVDDESKILQMPDSELRLYLRQMQDLHAKLARLMPVGELPAVSQLKARLATFHRVERLGEKAHQQEQRHLIKQFPVVFGIRNRRGLKAKRRTSDSSEQLQESTINVEVIPLNDISHVFVPYRQQQRERDMLEALALDIDGNPAFSRLAAGVVSIDVLRIIVSIRSDGESEERLNLVYRSLRKGTQARLTGQEIDRKLEYK